MSRLSVRPCVVASSLLALLLPFLPAFPQHSDLLFLTGCANAVDVSGGGSGRTVCISDPTPLQHTTVTVYGDCWGSLCSVYTGSIPMTATWHFESGDRTCSGAQDPGSSNPASCSVEIGAAPLGHRVNVDVVFGGLPLTTWFTPAVDCTTVTEIPPGECEGLLTLYSYTDRQGWANISGWLTTNTPCSWYGTTCDTGHISRLDLSSNNLSGFPPFLINLPNLQVLDLSNNHLVGRNTNMFSQTYSLRQLNLASNELSEIPGGVFDQVNLQVLDLSSDHLFGSIPAGFGKLIHLQVLDLSNNYLDRSIPAELGNLAGLQALDVSSNQLKGCLPQSLTNLHALQQFYFDTGVLRVQDNAAFAAWFAGIPDKSPGPWATCSSYYFPTVPH